MSARPTAVRSGAPGILGTRPPGRRPRARIALHAYAWAVIAYTLVPIGVMILYGFNQAWNANLCLLFGHWASSSAPPPR